jgi:hypothetical protein
MNQVEPWEDQIVTGNCALQVGRNGKLGMSFRDATLIVAEHAYGAKGRWSYACFEFINHTYFAGRLPWPVIQWALTGHGRCLGLTRPHLSRPPVITLHPSLLGGSEKQNPWGIPASWLGLAYAFDVMLHESIHVQVSYNLGGIQGKTSHNCPNWIGEVNRLAPLLGFDDVQAGLSKTRRIADESLPRTKRDKTATRVVRGWGGNLPGAAVFTFPHGLRAHQGLAQAHYESNVLPAGVPGLAG